MARAKDAKVSVTFRCDPVVLAAVDEEAGKRKIDRTAMIEARLAGLVRRKPSPMEMSACSHPKSKLRVFSWGTVCECGRRVR